MRKSRRGTKYVSIDTGRCTACWKCIDECKFGVLRALNMWFHKHVVVEDAEECRGCRRCIAVCPSGAFKDRDPLGKDAPAVSLSGED